jgi:hypothetical protein
LRKDILQLGALLERPGGIKNPIIGFSFQTPEYILNIKCPINGMSGDLNSGMYIDNVKLN